MIVGGHLHLSPTGTGEARLAYRFYPLRSGDRPAFGDFQATLAFQAGARSVPLSFGLLDSRDSGGWQVWLQYRAGQARPVRAFQGATDATSWRAVGLPHAPDALRLTRQGNVVEAEVDAGDAPAIVGRWQGTLPPIVGFGSAALPGGTEPVAVLTLTVVPLPRASAFSQPVPRAGQPLPGVPGGERLWGYFWGPGERPVIAERITNLKNGPNSLSPLA